MRLIRLPNIAIWFKTLDLRFESGAIGEQTHLRQRHILKQELKEVLRYLGMDDQSRVRV